MRKLIVIAAIGLVAGCSAREQDLPCEERTSCLDGCGRVEARPLNEEQSCWGELEKIRCGGTIVQPVSGYRRSPDGQCWYFPADAHVEGWAEDESCALDVPNCSSGQAGDVGIADAGSSNTTGDSGAPGSDATRRDAGQDAAQPDADASDVQAGPMTILVFSRTTGFRHGSIPDALAAITARAEQDGHAVVATEDPAVFEQATLADYDAVVFLMTTGDVLSESQQSGLESYIQNGGGWVGVHSASDTEYDWPWYGGLVGAYFDGHPAVQDAEIDVEDGEHASTAHLPARWARRDEWYNFAPNPRSNVHVLMTLDESTYEGGTMGEDHPIAWCHAYDGGRSWYTGGGHTSESYSEPEFLEHVWGGILYAAGRSGPCP